MPTLKVDLVTQDPSSGELVVYLVEDGPWPASPDQMNARLREIQDRLYLALDAAIDGQIAQRFPNARGRAIRIQVDSPSGCPAELQRLVERFRALVAEDSEYGRAIRDSVHLGSLRVLTGAELGRFNGRLKTR
jgi:hypothetical protein